VSNPDPLQRRRLLQTGLALAMPALAHADAAPMNPLDSLASTSLLGAPAVSLSRTHQVDLALAGRVRRLFVAVPEGPVPPQGHPVLWTLDGNTLFPLLAALQRQQAARPADMQGTLPVVVGLGLPGDEAYDQAARTDDYTVPRTAGSGQADRFLDMLAQQLQPWLAQQLVVDPARQTFFGHSFGGLLVLYALFTRPTLFGRYLAASPSIWWGDRVILSHRDAFLRREHHTPTQRVLQLTAGGLEDGTVQSNPERQRRQQERRQVGSARELVVSLSGVPGLKAGFHLLAGEDHGSLVLPSTVLALELAAGSFS